MSTVLELLGLVVLAVGLGMLAPWLGVAVAGGSCILLGLALDRRPAESPAESADVA